LAEEGQQWCEPKTLAEAQPRNRPIQVHPSTADYTQQNQQKIKAVSNKF
jgi:hypothetical protein